ncbi:cilia- and flagella-associated protein 52 isoform X2 [Physcomitrium patens]|uniref:Cilia- and flagella-associated protein 52 n=1 Tax=Physcomitrium patens TaxID=3218 RepID=A0A2K1IWU6_PHYPA|nr:cilia- and flagella-associated protein 52-like isoform X2 [Physcomitrium patens]PNR33749.1 hypothetical protein PHYPA_023565 [Physcomitrium patens]|eukprot:XP_024356612.1 cilia- and flagella-associated protein 52-like isoform X2 [Physcomitrella patens]
MSVRPLPLQACLGFGGTVANGLILHPDKKTLIYPLGTTIVLRDRGDLTKQEFLQGHNNQVSCVTVSRSGRYMASGQISPMGFSAPIIIWDYASRKLVHKLILHKVKIQGLDFSFDDELLTSWGGTDDCKLVIWRTKTGEAICGSPTPVDYAIAAKWANLTRNTLITTADMKINVWEVDAENRKLYPSICDTGKRKRVNQCVVIDDKDEYMYVGTRSGDIMQVSLGPKMYRAGGPLPMIELGVLCLQFTPFKDLVCGGGDGTVNLVRLPSFKNVKKLKLQGGVTSLTVAGQGDRGSFELYAGTAMAQIYLVKYDGATNAMTAMLIQRCHFNKINDIAFPMKYSDLFCTASTNDIRMWNLKEMKEILRIEVPNSECEAKDSLNQECHCCAFMPDGKTIISGWSDGRIRAFAPQTGKLQYTIVNAHQKMGGYVGAVDTKCFQGVYAIATTSDSLRIVSGGVEGNVRVWRIGSQSHSMLASMKAHTQACTYIAVKKDNSECVSCSNDGSCMVWDLTKYTRNNSIEANNFFKSVNYHPDESQLLTCGTDRKITFWDAYDCQPIRVIDGSLSADMLSLDISPDGEGFVSGGGDREVKLWNYDEGHCYFVGLGHSSKISRIKISPNMQKVVSVGEDGAILIWDYKKPISDSPPDKNVNFKSPNSPE